jgi:DNA-binding MarR family transcriptional regulator
MTAETIKPNKLPKLTRPTRKPSKTQIKILETKQAHPDLTVREIAAIADCNHSNVVQCLKRYEINKQNVIHYKDNRADIIADLQHRLLVSITDDEIKKAPLGTRILGMAQLYDKERLERGMSSENIQLIHADIAKIKGIQKQEP